MSNTETIYSSTCRFTDELVRVAHHGHGVRITLGTDDNYGGTISRFLTQGQADALADALTDANFGTPQPFPKAERIAELEAAIAADGLREAEQAERIVELETVPSGHAETDPVWDALAEDEERLDQLEQRLESDELDGEDFADDVSARLNRLETTVFTGQMETRMAIMQERIGRLEARLDSDEGDGESFEEDVYAYLGRLEREVAALRVILRGV